MAHRTLHALVMSPVVRLVLSVLVGLAAAVVTALAGTWALAVLVGIIATGTVFIGAGLAALWPLDGERTRRSARSEVLRPFADEATVAAAAVLGIIGVVVPLAVGHAGDDGDQSLLTAVLSVIAAFLCWAGLHLMYATRYADLYYDKESGGGIDFHGDADPCYRDFLYLGFAVGMTYGATDTDISRTAIRTVVLRHAVLSFVFGTVILATAIALVAGSL